MKPITQNIKNTLNHESIIQNLESLRTRHPGYIVNETSIEEVYDGFLIIKEAINESIDKDYFESIAFNRRNGMNSNIQNFHRYSGNINQVINQYHALLDQVQLSGLIERFIGELNFSKEFKELVSLRRKYKNIERDISNSKSINKELEVISKKADSFFQNVKSVSDKIEEVNKEIELDRVELAKRIKFANTSGQEIETKKKEIIAFQQRIGKSEQLLTRIEKTLQESIKEEIQSKLKKATELINEAETALELKQSEGIAKAYSSRLQKLSKNKRNIYWLVGAISFVILTLILGFLIAGGNINLFGFEIGFDPKENIGFIIGRITLTGIGLAGAIFCANRYVSLKNLEEDYEYKVVLSKSILAFSNKISEIDKERLPDYLVKVLDELHQDPLRDRKHSKKNEIDVNTLSKFKDFMNMWSDMNK